MDNNAIVYFSFLSQNKNRHQLIIQTSELTASHNEFIKYKPESLFIDTKDAKIFLKQILEKNLRKSLLNQKKQLKSNSKYK